MSDILDEIERKLIALQPRVARLDRIAVAARLMIIDERVSTDEETRTVQVPLETWASLRDALLS